MILPHKYKASLQISVDVESLNDWPCALTVSELNHSPAFSQTFLSPTLHFSLHFPAGFENDQTVVTHDCL